MGEESESLGIRSKDIRYGRREALGAGPQQRCTCHCLIPAGAVTAAPCLSDYYSLFF